MLGAYQACMDAQSLYSNFDSLSSVRQEVLANMAYNLGKIGLSRFVKLKAAIEQSNFYTAAYEMRDSRWYRQVGGRANRLVALMDAD
jgi:lysozyme